MTCQTFLIPFVSIALYQDADPLDNVLFQSDCGGQTQSVMGPKFKTQSKLWAEQDKHLGRFHTDNDSSRNGEFKQTATDLFPYK